MEGGLNGVQARVADGSRGQALNLIGVVVAVGQSAAGGHILLPLIGIEGGGVALQPVDAILRAKSQAVVEDGGDIGHVLGVGGLPLDDGGQGDHLVQRHSGGGDVFLQIRGAVLEVVHQLAHHGIDLLALVEIVGVGEKVALQLVILARNGGNGGYGLVAVKVGGVDGRQEILLGADTVLLQKGGGLQGGGAFGEGDAHLLPGLVAPCRVLMMAW